AVLRLENLLDRRLETRTLRAVPRRTLALLEHPLGRALVVGQAALPRCPWESMPMQTQKLRVRTPPVNSGLALARRARLHPDPPRGAQGLARRRRAPAPSRRPPGGGARAAPRVSLPAHGIAARAPRPAALRGPPRVRAR